MNLLPSVQDVHGAIPAAPVAGLGKGLEPEVDLVALDGRAAVGSGGHAVVQEPFTVWTYIRVP